MELPICTIFMEISKQKVVRIILKLECDFSKAGEVEMRR